MVAVSDSDERIAAIDEVLALLASMEGLQARKVIERAKGMLMEQKALTEEQAYSLIKKASMNMRKPMIDVAEAIILTRGLLKNKKS